MTATSALADVRARFTWAVRVAPWVVTGALVVLAVRLGGFVDRYTVNILYWDQWDFLQGLFDGADPWTLFRWQHGPQRQGLGNLILAILYPATGWNGRVDAAASAFVMLLAALAALWLVKRLCGRLAPWDIVVPLLFLTTVNAETYVVAPNIAHGPISALLLVGYALALTIPSHSLRCGAIVILNFFCVSTSFTWLLGGITPVLLFLLAHSPGVTGRDRAMYAAGIAASVATLAFFFYGFRFESATGCFQFPHARPWEYFPYTGFVLGRPFGLVPDESVRRFLAATGVALGMAAFVSYAIVRAIRSRGDSNLWLVTSCLTGFTLLFAASCAVGRICLGFPSASASRYVPYILPGLLALYLVVRNASARSAAASALLPVLVIACLVKERDIVSQNEAETYATYKARWRDCYLSTHNIEACDTLAGHAVYPAPLNTNLQQKLDWLEARQLSLFREDGADSR